MLGFWISKVTQGLPIFINIRGFSICGKMQLWKGSEYSRIRNIQGSADASVTQGSEYTWTRLNNAWINCSDYGSKAYFRKKGRIRYTEKVIVFLI